MAKYKVKEGLSITKGDRVYESGAEISLSKLEYEPLSACLEEPDVSQASTNASEQATVIQK